MENQSPTTPYLRFVRKVVLVCVLIMIAAGITCWLLGWRGVRQYGDGVTLTGMIAVAIGFYSLIGASTAGKGIPYQYAETGSRATPYERARQFVKDINQAYTFPVSMGTVEAPDASCRAG